MPLPKTSWIDDLPTHRLIGEFSVWSGDLLRLGDELARIAPYADMLHIDIADGHFAPALLFFPDLVAAIRKQCSIPIHIHMMVADGIVLAQIEQFAAVGSDLISVHVENESVVDGALDLIESKGIAAGLVLQIETPVERAARYLPRLRFLTLLGTAIGVKGKGLDDRAGDRIRCAKQLITDANGACRIVLAADGGIREHTVPTLRESGAETVVLGSLAFEAPDLAARMRWLHAL